MIGSLFGTAACYFTRALGMYRNRTTREHESRARNHIIDEPFDSIGQGRVLGLSSDSRTVTKPHVDSLIQAILSDPQCQIYVEGPISFGSPAKGTNPTRIDIERGPCHDGFLGLSEMWNVVKCGSNEEVR